MSQSPVQEHFAAKERPYADYVEATYGRRQKWLVNFLRHGPGYGDWPPLPQRTHIYVLDSIQTGMSKNVFSPKRGEKVDSRFLAALNNRNPDCKTQLLIVESGGLNQVNIAYIDAIAWHYRLDPLFLCKHFSPMLKRDREWAYHNDVLPAELPSETKYLQIFATRDDYVTAAFVADKLEQTGMIRLFHVAWAWS